MNGLELAKVKVDRAIRLIQDFDSLDVNSLQTVLTHLTHALQLAPNGHPERDELYGYLQFLNKLSFERYGAIFKGVSWKTAAIIGPNELKELVWRVNASMPQ